MGKDFRETWRGVHNLGIPVQEMHRYCLTVVELRRSRRRRSVRQSEIDGGPGVQRCAVEEGNRDVLGLDERVDFGTA